MRESLADWERLLLFQLLPAHNRDHDDHDDDDDDDDDDNEEDDEEEDHHHHHNDPWIQRTSAGLWAWANRKLLHEPRELLSIRDARKKRLLRPTLPHPAPPCENQALPRTAEFDIMLCPPLSKHPNDDWKKILRAHDNENWIKSS